MNAHRLLTVAALPALLGPILLGLAGCGFQPLYAVSGVTPKLQAIDVQRPDGRTGFLMGQSLDDELGHDAGSAPVYRLTSRVNETRIPRGLNINNQATRYEVDLTATYRLIEIKTGKEVTKGTVSVNATYNDLAAPYATLAAELDGERRAAEEAARRIRLDLATYFAAPRPDTPGLTPPSTSNFSELHPSQTVQSPREQAEDRTPAASDTPSPGGLLQP